MMTKAGTRFLVWEYLEGTTMEELLIECDTSGSLLPLAKALGVVIM
jgi:hypothetical protein